MIDKIFTCGNLEIDFNNISLNTYNSKEIQEFWESYKKKKSAIAYPLVNGPVLNYDNKHDLFYVTFGSPGDKPIMRYIIPLLSMQKLTKFIEDICKYNKATIIVVTGKSGSGKTTFIKNLPNIQKYPKKIVVASYTAENVWLPILPIGSKVYSDVANNSPPISKVQKDSVIIFDNMWNTIANNKKWKCWIDDLYKKEITIIFEENKLPSELGKIATNTFCID